MRIRSAIDVLGGLDEICRAAAQLFRESVTSAVEQRGLATVCLAGGSTPRRLYSMIAQEEATSPRLMPWGAIHFFWGDERHVPHDHPDSNYRMARETLLSRLRLPAANVHRIPAEDADAAAAAKSYERHLGDFFASRGMLEDGVPRFDLVLLGLGPDGHTASLFPGTGVIHETVRLVEAPWVPRLESHRITLTVPVLNNARTLVFLVSGEDKAEALRAVLEGEHDADRYPAQAIAPRMGKIVWLLDGPAARLLSAH